MLQAYIVVSVSTCDVLLLLLGPRVRIVEKVTAWATWCRQELVCGFCCAGISGSARSRLDNLACHVVEQQRREPGAKNRSSRGQQEEQIGVRLVEKMVAGRGTMQQCQTRRAELHEAELEQWGLAIKATGSGVRDSVIGILPSSKKRSANDNKSLRQRNQEDSGFTSTSHSALASGIDVSPEDAAATL
ncbi:hypothetical protein FVE85_7275 [Porphyridium purpureum]|uniref:Uncharacterized protein n=1 Tax=Porphyridium purpureum TaxID=35688 RepID=A0A5J4Z990_PORPP|nr:hypothetical protein FVE85_7275 [Porphyridium purpureum]|eukprot:POR3995..scf295_1